MNSLDRTRLKMTRIVPQERTYLLETAARRNMSPEVLAMAEALQGTIKGLGIVSALVVLQAIGLELSQIGDNK